MLRTRHAASEAEIDLLLERVHFGHLDLDLVAQPNDAARAAPDQAVLLGIENIKVIGHGGEWHQAAHGEAGNIHEEPEVAGVRDECRVALGISGRELLLEERKEFHVFAIAFRIGGITFSSGYVIGDFLERGGGTALLLKESAMHDEVGIPANGRGEVRVFGFGKAVMAERLDGVAGAHEGLEKTDLEGRADGKRRQLVEQLLNFGSCAEVTALDAMAQDFFAVFLEPAFFWFFVNAVNGGPMLAHEVCSHPFIGQEHEFLD
jgi:hypothetical protein